MDSAPASGRSDFAADPGATAPVEPPRGGLPEGGVIGRFRLLEPLGEGGWGMVYLAEQSEPVRRRVALKVIKLGMDTRSVLARFEAERQALAMMDHPNIARVLDAGATESGRPYFVMELVRGLRITEFCDRHRLALAQRLRLFLQVCSAVQHAHRKGIIHRDLKPSNILVAGEGTAAAVKVIDFGIAKSVHARLADATLYTRAEQAIGTPAYMSPEQADSDGLDLDTRSDVYALGVVLYELLAGRLPFDAATLDRAGPEGMRRIIREEEPPRPSQATRRPLTSDQPDPAVARGLAPAQLPAKLRGELDWIVMRAIEKRRERRYESVAALADDIERFLANEPVRARPPSRTYLLGKFVARHRLGVFAGTTVALTLVVATGVSVRQARVARSAEVQAREAYRRSDELLDFMTGDLLREFENLSRLDILESVGERAMKHFAARSPDLVDDSTHVQAATVLRLMGVARLRQDKQPEAIRNLQDAVARVGEVLARQPQNLPALFERSQAEFYLGEAYRKQRELGRALEWLTRYRQTALQLVAIEPREYRWQKEAISGLHNLAVLKRDSGDLEGAKRDMLAKRDALRKLVVPSTEGAAERDDVARKIQDASSWLGSIAEQSGELGAALMYFQEEARGLQQLLATSPDQRGWQYRQAENLTFQSTVLAITGRVPEARQVHAQALATMRTLAASGQQQARWRRLLLRLELRELEFARTEGGVAPMSPAIEGMVLRARALVDTAPDDSGLRRLLAAGLRLQAEACAAKELPRAKALLEEALERGQPGRLAGPLQDAESAAGEFAQTCLVLAELDSARRESLMNRAAAALEPYKNSRNWRVLDPWVRVQLLRRNTSAAEETMHRVATIGYVSSVPWPKVDR